jgi:hypothetical protein
MTFWDVITFLLIGYFVGQFHALFKFNKILSKVINDELSEDSIQIRKVFKLEVENINDQLYLFERETHDFICQATSIQELALKAKDYRNVILATVIHDNKVFMFRDGEVREYISQDES